MAAQLIIGIMTNQNTDPFNCYSIDNMIFNQAFHLQYSNLVPIYLNSCVRKTEIRAIK